MKKLGKVIVVLVALVLAMVPLAFAEDGPSKGKTFKYPDKGDDVLHIQVYLQELGFYKMELDGAFGRGTQSAVREYQKSKEVEITGAVNEDLLANLKADYLAAKRSLAEGENLLNNTDRPVIREDISDYALGYWKTTGSTEGTRQVVDVADSPVKKLKKGVRLVSVPGKGNTNIYIGSVPYEYEGIYVISCYIRGTGKVRMGYGKGDKYKIHSYTAQKNWRRVSFAFQVGFNDGCTADDPFNTVIFGASDGEAASDVTICGMKIEKPVPTEWN